MRTSPAAIFNRSNKLMVGFIELVIWYVHITFPVIVLLTKSDVIVCQYVRSPYLHVTSTWYDVNRIKTYFGSGGKFSNPSRGDG